MTRLCLLLVSLSAMLCVPALAAPADDAPSRSSPRKSHANPSATIASEIAMKLRARDKGQMTAMREFAAEQAVLFVPEPVDARDWLKRQPEPATPADWQVHDVWMSCDGSLAATRGAWQNADGTAGRFTTIWARQKKKGDYLWVARLQRRMPEPLAAPEMISAQIAKCRSSGRAGKTAALNDEEGVSLPEPSLAGVTDRGQAKDASLLWRILQDASGASLVRVSAWNGQSYDHLFNSGDSEVPPAI